MPSFVSEAVWDMDDPKAKDRIRRGKQRLGILPSKIIDMTEGFGDKLNGDMHGVSTGVIVDAFNNLQNEYTIAGNVILIGSSDEGYRIQINGKSFLIDFKFLQIYTDFVQGLSPFLDSKEGDPNANKFLEESIQIFLNIEG